MLEFNLILCIPGFVHCTLPATISHIVPVVDMEIPAADVADDEVLSEYLGGLRLPDGGGAVGVGVAHPDEGGRGAVHPLAVDVEAAPGVGVPQVGVSLL